MADPLLIREYVHQLITPEVTSAASALLSEIQRMQERAHLQNAVKAAMRKRYVCGLREVLRALKTNKAKALIVAHNIEQIEAEGGLDDVMVQVRSPHHLPTISSLLPAISALLRPSSPYSRSRPSSHARSR